MPVLRSRPCVTVVAACLLVTLLWACSTPPPISDRELSQKLEESNLVLTPRGVGPFPAVLLLHSCYGNLGHVNAWAQDLQSRGYVAVVVNSMQARGLGGHFDRLAVCGGGILRPADRARDIRVSIEKLRRLEKADTSRIGLLGFSHGGWTALAFVGQRSEPMGEETSADSALGVRSIVVVYPYCGEEAVAGLERWPRDIQMLMLLAGSDTTVGTSKCRALAQDQKSRGYYVRLHVYPGARHGYDINPALLLGYDRRYDESAAEDTRKRIIGFLNETLATGAQTASSLRPTRRPASPTG